MIERRITVEQARRKLGKCSDKMKDQDIQAILNSLYFLSEQAVKDLMEKGEKEVYAN